MSKENGRVNIERDLAILIDEIRKRDFKSRDELKDFMSNLDGQYFDDLLDSNDKKDRSQELVYEAYEQTASKGKKLVKQALELDPNNTDAYNYLASQEKNIDNAIKQYEKGIKAGEKVLGKKFFKEEKGSFWGMPETRPYMRAKAGLAHCFYAKNEVDKAIEIYEEMLELNPDDNQGIRYILSSLLLSKNDLTSFEQFIKTNEDEDCAVWNYNNALYNYKKSGKTAKSEKILLKAFNSNKFVIAYMLGYKEMPKEQPQYIGIGDENEAVSYVGDVWAIWEKTDGALDWLYDFKQKRLKIN